jgi:predicted O-methyltransferase YrrM
MAIASKRKTSFEIDPAKVEAAKEVLGTKGLTDTVDAALAEVIALRQRLRLLELLEAPGALQLNDAEVMRGAWR